MTARSQTASVAAEPHLRNRVAARRHNPAALCRAFLLACAMAALLCETCPAQSQIAGIGTSARIYGARDRERAVAALRSIEPARDAENVAHDANSVLGLVALQEGRTEEAKRYLLKAGATPGSPQVDNFGPPMLLARRLTEKGEIAAVLTYLDLVSKSWERTELSPDWKKGLTADEIAGRLEAYARNGQKLAEWKKLVRKGVVPDDWLWNRDPGAYL